jgi:outer membrane protein assembly factor BamA
MGKVRPFLGLGFSYVDLRDYTGRSVDAVDPSGRTVSAREAETMLAADCAAGVVVGCGGGFDNVLRLAISYDTRDFEPDPNAGIYAELSNELSMKALGTDYPYARVLASVRGFYSPVPKLADLVLAVRGLYEIQSVSTPFFSQVVMPFIDDGHAGLGGLRTLRGFDQNRFVGPVIALTNYEVRWTFTHVHLWKQDFGLIAVPFLDIGRVFDRVSQTTLRGWKRTQGAGFRVAWNEATVVAADFGVSEEGTGLYLNFNHIF